MTYVCKHCGSADLVFTATVRWIPEEQRWSTVDVWETRANCSRCEDSTMVRKVSDEQAK